MIVDKIKRAISKERRKQQQRRERRQSQSAGNSAVHDGRSKGITRSNDEAPGGNLPSASLPAHPSLPTALLVHHVMPYLDRQSWNALVRSTREIWKESTHLINGSHGDNMDSGPQYCPPWPQRKIAAQHRINAIAFAPTASSRQLIAMACRKLATIQLWDQWRGNKYHQVLKGHEGEVLCVSFSFDGKLLASSSVDRTIRVWKSGNQVAIMSASGNATQLSELNFVTVHCWSVPSRVESLSFPSATSDRLVSLDYQDVATVWSTYNQDANSSSSTESTDDTHVNENQIYELENVFYNCATLSADGQSLVAVQWKDHLLLQGLPLISSATPLAPPSVAIVGEADSDNKSSRITSVVVDRDERYVIAGCNDWTLKIYQAPTLTCIRSIDLIASASSSLMRRECKPYISDLQFSDDGARLAFSYYRTHRDCAIQIWENVIARRQDGDTVQSGTRGDGELICSPNLAQILCASGRDRIETLSLSPGDGNVVAFCNGRNLHLQALDR